MNFGPTLKGSSPEFLRNLATEMGPTEAMAFDVDGTLAGADSKISARTIDALARLAQTGTQPIIITGRVWPAAAKPLHEANCPGIAISNNGAVIGNGETDQILYQSPMPASMSGDLINTGREYDLSITLFLLDSMVSDRDDYSAAFLKDANEGVPVEIRDIDAVDPSSILKIMYWHEDPAYLDRIAPDLLSRFPDLQRSLDNYFEVVGPDEGKKQALHKAIEILGWDPARMAGFGDGGNDVHWMPETGWPIAMENARAEVIAISRAQIGHHDEDGIANFIDAYLEVHG